MIRGREVRARLQKRNVDPELRLIVEALAEDFHHLQSQVHDFAKIVDAMIDRQNELLTIAGRMREAMEATQEGKNAIEKINKRYKDVASEEIPR